MVAIISAATAIAAAVLSAAAQRSVKRVEQRFEGAQRSLAFRSDQLARLYLPVSMHLRATRALATTHYTADEATQTEIEHALHEHNKVVFFVLRVVQASPQCRSLTLRPGWRQL